MSSRSLYHLEGNLTNLTNLTNLSNLTSLSNLSNLASYLLTHVLTYLH